MHRAQDEELNDTAAPRSGDFHWGRFALWMAACAVHGGVVAWLAALLERSWAPILLFSLVVGVALGATLVGMMRLAEVGNRATILLGTVLAASTAVAGQHYLGYRAAREEAREDRTAYDLAKLALGDRVLGPMPVPPEGFVQFLRWRAARGFPFWRFYAQGLTVWLIWTGDALVVLAAALALVVPAWRRPYCSRCRSWWRTTRCGRIDAERARHLAALVDTELPVDVASARYWLATCRGGCGLAGFELRWEKPNGDASRAKVCLGQERRNLVMQTLDREIASGRSMG